MLYRWRQRKETDLELSSLLGLKVRSITRGEFEGRKTIEIEVDKLSAEQLKKLNDEFVGYQRDYSVAAYEAGETRSLEAEVDDLKTQVSNLAKEILP